MLQILKKVLELLENELEGGPKDIFLRKSRLTNLPGNNKGKNHKILERMRARVYFHKNMEMRELDFRFSAALKKQKLRMRLGIGGYTTTTGVSFLVRPPSRASRAALKKQKLRMRLGILAICAF